MKNILTKQLVLEDYVRLTKHKRSGLRGFFYKKYLREPSDLTEADVQIILSKCIMKERTRQGTYLHFDKFGRVYTWSTGEVSRTDKPDCDRVKWDENFYIAKIRGDKKTAIFYACDEWILS